MELRSDPHYESEVIMALLEREAHKLRQGRRFYFLILSAYVLVVLGYLGFRIVDAIRQPEVRTRPHGRILSISPAPETTGLRVYAGPGDIAISEVIGSTGSEPLGPVNKPQRVFSLEAIPWGVVTGMLLVSGITLLYTLRALRSQKGAARQLAELDDVRAIGPLCEALQIDDREIKSLVKGRLVELLPRLRADHAGALTAVQKSSLHAVLYRKTSPLTFAILEGFQQVGDAADLPAVDFAGESDPDVREPARICREYIESRAAATLHRSTLLRPSSTGGQANLVRPAASPNTEVSHLLRPTADSGGTGR